MKAKVDPGKKIKDELEGLVVGDHINIILKPKKDGLEEHFLERLAKHIDEGSISVSYVAMTHEDEVFQETVYDQLSIQIEMVEVKEVEKPYSEVAIGQRFKRAQEGLWDFQFIRTTPVRPVKCSKEIFDAVCIDASDGPESVQGWHYLIEPDEIVKVLIREGS